MCKRGHGGFQKCCNIDPKEGRIHYDNDESSPGEKFESVVEKGARVVETEVLVRRQVAAERLEILDVAVELEFEQPLDVAPLVLEDYVAGARDLQKVVLEDLRNFLLPLARQFCNAKISVSSPVGTRAVRFVYLSGWRERLRCPGSTPFCAKDGRTSAKTGEFSDESVCLQI